MKKLLLAIAFAIFASCASAEPLRIVNNYGGSVKQFAEAVENHPEVILSGVCASACTLYLYSENACTERDTIFWFHGPSGPNAEIALYVMRALYAQKSHQLLDWFDTNAAALVGADYVELTAAQLVAMNAVEWCED